MNRAAWGKEGRGTHPWVWYDEQSIPVKIPFLRVWETVLPNEGADSTDPKVNLFSCNPRIIARAEKSVNMAI